MPTTETRTAKCGCTITGRFFGANPECPVRIAYRTNEITGYQLTTHNRRVAKEAK